MASRAQQKEEARQRRLAEEQARAAQAQRQRRNMTLLGIVLIAVIVVGVAVVALSSSGSKGAPSVNSSGGSAEAAKVTALLAGIPQTGQTLGNSAAKVSVTEYGDLECPICRDFALGAEQQLIQKDVRAGKVTLSYKSLCTATCNGPNQAVFPTQQAAAIAAGQQGKGWNYIELFYHLQGSEGSTYVNDAFLNGLAQKIPGLNFSQWSSARQQNALAAQVTADQQGAQTAGYNSTPTLVVKGPKGQASAIVGSVPYSQIESAIQKVE